MLLLPSTALASSVVALSEAELVAASDTIVVGTVVQVAPAISDHNTIRTHVLLEVQLGVRGAREGDVVTVDIPGGDMHGIRHLVAGTPTFKPGQLVLAFLKDYGTLRRPLGLSYGIYALALDKSGTWMASRDLSGLALLAKGGQHLPPSVTSGGERFDVLLPRVQEHVRALREGVK